jgi:hypothetical protein
MATNLATKSSVITAHFLSKGANMIKWLLDWFFPSRMQLSAEEMALVLQYDKRRHRALPPSVESEASHAMPMMIYRAEPGQYVGLGNQVIKERRRWRRIPQQQLRIAEELMRQQIATLEAEGYINVVHDEWVKEEK